MRAQDYLRFFSQFNNNLSNCRFGSLIENIIDIQHCYLAKHSYLQLLVLEIIDEIRRIVPQISVSLLIFQLMILTLNFTRLLALNVTAFLYFETFYYVMFSKLKVLLQVSFVNDYCSPINYTCM